MHTKGQEKSKIKGSVSTFMQVRCIMVARAIMMSCLIFLVSRAMEEEFNFNGVGLPDSDAYAMYSEDDPRSATEKLYAYLSSSKSSPSLESIRNYVEKQGADVNGNVEGIPLLQKLILRRGVVAPQEQEEWLESIRYFLEKGANPNMVETHFTIFDPEVDPEKGEWRYSCPLQWVRSINTYNTSDCKSLIRLLFEYGANPAIKNDRGQNAFFNSWRSLAEPLTVITSHETMCHYLLHCCGASKREGQKYICKNKKVVVTSGLYKFFDCASRLAIRNEISKFLPEEIKRRIISFCSDEVDYPETVKRELQRIDYEDLPIFITRYPLEWTRQAIQQLKKEDSAKAEIIAQELWQQYVKAGKEILEEKDNENKRAKDNIGLILFDFTPKPADLLDPDQFEEHFSRDDIINYRSK